MNMAQEYGFLSSYSDLYAFINRTTETDATTLLTNIGYSSYARMLQYTNRTRLAYYALYSGSGVGSAGTFTPSSAPSWTVNAYAGCELLVGSTYYPIISNSATVLTVTGTPASSTGYVYPLQTEDYTDLRSGNLWLRAAPIITVNSVYLDGDTTDTIDSSDYVVMSKDGYLHMDEAWDYPDDYLTVSYRGGYQSTDAEWSILRHIQLRIGTAMFKDTGFVRFLVDQNGDIGSYVQDSSREIAKILEELAPYRRLVF